MFNPAMHIINNSDTRGTGYADDLILLRSGYSKDKSIQIIQNTLNKLTQWGKTCGLVFNPDKTVVTYFTKKKSDLPEQCVKMGDKNIPYSDSFKYLGVTIDNKLTWKIHRDNVLQKAKWN